MYKMETSRIQWTVSLLCFTVLISQSHGNSHGGGHHCKKVIKEEIQCLAHGAAFIQCEEDEVVTIVSAKVYKSNIPKYVGTCQDEHVDGTFSVVDDVTCEVKSACSPSLTDLTGKNLQAQFESDDKDKMSECSAEILEDDLPDDPDMAYYGSKPYMVIQYICDPVFKVDMVNGKAMLLGLNKTYPSSKVHIDSSTRWYTNKIKDEEKKCCIRVPPNTEFLYYPSVFKKWEGPQGGCAQRLEFSNEMGKTEFCKGSTFPKTIPCSEHEEAYELSYVTDSSVEVSFVFNAQVASDATMVVECGLEPDAACEPPPTTAGPTTTQGPTTPTTAYTGVSTPSPSTPSPPITTPTPTEGTTAGTPEPPTDTDLLPIIIGAALAALLLFILVAICVCTRGGGGSTVKDEVYYVQEEDSTSPIVTMQPMYVPGDNMTYPDQTSTLTMYKSPDPMISGQGYMNAGSMMMDPGQPQYVMQADPGQFSSFQSQI